MIPLQFSLAKGLALLLIVSVCACVAFKADADATRRQVTSLQLELATRELAEDANEAARPYLSAGRAEVEQIFRRHFQESANAPLSASCASDPAIARAYDTIERMSDAHADAIRNAGRQHNKRSASGADGQP